MSPNILFSSFFASQELYLTLVVLSVIYILSLKHYLACRGMKLMMNFFFQGWTFFSWDQREVRLTGSHGKKRSPTTEKKFIKGFSFLYSSQISCLRRQIHFFTQLPHVQPSDLRWLTYFNIPLILSLWKFPGVSLKILYWIFNLKSF